MTIPTNLDSGFRIKLRVLADALEKVSRPWVYVSGPAINATGFLYSDDDIRELFSVYAKYGAKVVIDTSSGLEYQTNGRSPWNLERCLSLFKALELSFELTTSGLDFKFLILNDSSLVDKFCSFPSLSRPHSTLKYSFRKLLGLKNQKDQHFNNLIMEQKETLKNHANHLMKASFL